MRATLLGSSELTWNMNMASFSLYSHCFMAVSTSAGVAGSGELQP